MKCKIIVPNQIRGKSPYTPLQVPSVGATYVATALAKEGHDVEVLDEYVLDHPIDPHSIKADLVGVSAMTVNINRGYYFAREIKRKYPETVIVGGGPHMTFMPNEALDNYIDIVARGEGDQIIIDIARTIEAKGRLESILGISFIGREGQTVHNTNREFIQNLDALPYPDYSLVRGLSKRMWVYPLSRLRGCSWPCTFCSVKEMHGRKFRYRSAENVIGELKSVWPLRKGLIFTDDSFFANQEEGKRLMKEMKQERIIPEYWATQMRVNVSKDEEAMRLMEDTNFGHAYVGLESINPRTLKEYKKGQSVDDIKFFIRRMHDIGAKIFGMFVLGSDSDNLDTVKATADFFCNEGIERGQLTSLTPLVGTELRAQWERQTINGKPRIITNDWSKYDLETVVHTPMQMTTRELQEALNNARMQTYSLKRAGDFLCSGRLKDAIATVYLGHLLRMRPRRHVPNS